MKNKNNIGIYFSDSPFPVSELISHIKKLDNIRKVWSGLEINFNNPAFLISEILKFDLTKIIIVGNTAGFVKDFFVHAMTKVMGNSENIQLVNFSENNINPDNIDRAKAFLSCAILDIPIEFIFENLGENEVNNQTLVIGGGIAGIQASLEIAASGNKVFLLEKTGTIGGHMAMFDKTFPTLDCAACILTPKMVDVGQNPNIQLLTYSEIQKVTGVPGNFKVKILQKARRVNLSTCIGCGICENKCPTSVLSEFDSKTTLRKAIYIPFPQAVPNKYLIDEANCRWVQEDKKCGVCVKVCPVPDCINLDAEDTEIEINVGNIIVATGFKTFDAKKVKQFGYGEYPNVLTSIEFERIINASGPTEGNIFLRSKDKKGNEVFIKEGEKPEKVAIIHCVGSRDENYNEYCSKVCCMYSLKFAHLVKEKLPNAEVFEYYIDMRAFGKGYEEFYNRIHNEGINIIRGRTAKITQVGKQLILRSEDIENDKLIEQKVDMVILSVGLEPHEDAKKVANILNLETDHNGWFKELNYLRESTETINSGIHLAGVCQGPKDIPDTVVQASAAAARVIQSILNGKIKQNINQLSLQEIESKAKELSTY